MTCMNPIEKKACDVCWNALGQVLPRVTTRIDPESRTRDVFRRNRLHFEQWFSLVAKELDLYSVMTVDDIPRGEEFERFPQLVDAIAFLVEKYVRKVVDERQHFRIVRKKPRKDD